MAPKTDTNKPALDLSALVPVEAEVPKMQRERKHRDNPFTAWLAESFEQGTGKSVTVPNANVGEVEYLIRRAADDLNIGARVVKTEDSPKKGQTTVVFAGKERKTRRTSEQVAADNAAQATA